MSNIRYKVDGHIATLTIDRPAKLNALTLQMYQDLGRAFIEAREDDRVRVVVLTGSGERAFCVGADLTESIPALASDNFDISEWDDAHLKHTKLNKPVICAVNGLCFGGGFEIMLGTDIRIAAEQAEFSLPEAGLGIVPAGGTLVRLARQIPYAFAMELLVSGKRFTARRLAEMGLINHVVPAPDLLPAAYELAAAISRLSPGAVQLIKQAVGELADLPMDDAFRREAVLGQRAFTSADAKLGLKAFLAGQKVSY
ncbi:enoyl-CoA hydratase/isomerase family protein [Paraburkholderia sp. BCC1886]|uniref:enoyl-CoA hydratase/isomerase family protein n=1 Tax=Paraburkholderia sp. BCC1886 TaxID=2562670 RepID=UPI001183AF40|nr:enoyl-CoA hydratase/isomerase family protein [Paraburkholderia sp. BCC1886]